MHDMNDMLHTWKTKSHKFIYECILAVHVAFNCLNIKTDINAQYTKYEASDEFVLSHLTNDNSNKGAVDESEIYGCHYTKIAIYPEKTLRIYYVHWWQNVTDRATVTEWAVNFRQRFYNALVVEYKYSDSLPID